MANPTLTPFPTPPLPEQDEVTFNRNAANSLLAQANFVTEGNIVITWMGQQIDAAAASKKAAADSATAAGQALTDAQAQAGNAKTSADAAARSLTSTETVAAAVRAQINLPSLVGQKGKFWVVNDDEKTLGLQQLTINQVGDTIVSTQAPDSTWVPTGGIYMQSLYPALFAKLGRLPDFREDQMATFYPDSNQPYSITAVGGGLLYMSAYSTQRGRQEFLISSDNGATWAASQAGANYLTYGGAYGNNTYVGAGYNTGVVLVSTNNAVITQYGIPNESWYSTAFGNNLFVTVAQTIYRFAVSSDNGRTWTTGNFPNNHINPKVVFVSGLFVAFGNNAGVYYTSANGTTWTQRSLPSGISSIFFDGIAVTNGLLAVLTQAYAYTTRDGINWTTASTNLPFSFDQSHRLAANDGVFVVNTPAGVGRIYFSANLQQWSLRNKITTPIGQNHGPLIGANGFFFITNGSNGYVYRLKATSYGASQFYGTDPMPAPVGLANFIKAA